MTTTAIDPGQEREWIISTFFCPVIETEEGEAVAEEISDTRHCYELTGSRAEAEAAFNKVVRAFNSYQSQLESIGLVFSNGLPINADFCLPSIHLYPKEDPTDIIMDY